MSDSITPTTSEHEKKRVLFVCSAGGHLSQLLQLRPWWENHDRRWVTFDIPDAWAKLKGETLIPAYHPTTRSLPNTIRNYRLAREVLSDWRPDVVVSNGAGAAVPFFLHAKKLGIPTVYIEVYDRIDSRTLSGRLCLPLSTKFCVQWSEQQELYEGSENVGLLY